MQNFEEVATDPILREAGVFRPMEGERTSIAGPADVDAHVMDRAVGAAPELGQHTEEILLEIGYDWDSITAFVANGVIP